MVPGFWEVCWPHHSLMLPQVDRKLVKQTVMTSVYGVTFIGARQQISQRLKERGLKATQEDYYRAACYAATVSSSHTYSIHRGVFGVQLHILNTGNPRSKAVSSWSPPVEGFGG